MAHYAYINDDNLVVEVITGINENEIVNDITDWEAFYTTQREGLRAVRTSYNTVAGEHLAGGTPFRGNYAGIGFTYDEQLDAFIPPKPFDSWTLDINTFSWVAPVPYPEDGELYAWDEDTGAWVETGA
jgi:hypothetical protein